MDIFDAIDFIIDRAENSDFSLTNLKLQKLLYYCQAWHLAFYERPQFDEKFQAWIHGPVSRRVFDRFSTNKSLYSTIKKTDIRPTFSMDSIEAHDRTHILTVLESYADFSDTDLEEMTHQEKPWIEARKGYSSNERCEKVISEETMKTYYASRLSK